MTYHWVCNKSNTTGTTCGAGTAYSSGAHALTSDVERDSERYEFTLSAKKEIMPTRTLQPKTTKDVYRACLTVRLSWL
jgi:hypothetical protein